MERKALSNFDLNPDQNKHLEGWISELRKSSWMIDNFSTILSRKHSFHKRIGKLQLVKIKKEEK